jgi:hypothetical protein
MYFQSSQRGIDVRDSGIASGRSESATGFVSIILLSLSTRRQ